jgi:hypothetical protein
MERAVDGAIRLARAWNALNRERRRAAVAAAVLWLTLFLPWYQATVVSHSARTHGALSQSESISGWGSFGLVQALILIVSLGVLVFLFLCAEGRGGELPGGDGRTVTGAGALSLLLVIIGLFTAPSPATHGQYVLSTGLDWGIFLALLAAAGLTWAGGRIRRSLEHDPFLAENRRATAQATDPEEPQAGGPDEAARPSPAPVRAPDAADAADAAEAGQAREQRPAADPAEEPTRASGGAAEPLTAAAMGARPEKAEDESQPDPGSAPADQAPRSSWRPAERPDWTDPERPMGWLTAPSKHQRSEDETE